ncbi:MAG: hypothetical protein GY754_19190 [bacterium]|nr:hypothetical protein [bacterium]
MKRKFNFSVMSLFLAVVFLFAGCEEGLNSNDSSGGSDGEFSFSDMYEKIKLMDSRVTTLEGVNQSQATTIGSQEAVIASLEAVIAEQASRIESLESADIALQSDVSGFTTLLEGVSRLTDPNTGQPTIRFSGVNVQIVSGSGYTIGVVDPWQSGTVNGLGNLIVGYNELGMFSGDNRSGSHNIIIGIMNNYSSYGGIVAGTQNTISGQYASITGGSVNIASGEFSSVSGGYINKGIGSHGSVSGGTGNRAEGKYASVSGGSSNRATGWGSSVSGSGGNNASGNCQHLP